MYGLWITRRRAVSQRVSKSKKASVLRSKAALTLFLAAAIAFVIATDVSAEEDQAKVGAGWVYSTSNQGGAVEHMDLTRAAEDATWFALA